MPPFPSFQDAPVIVQIFVTAVRLKCDLQLKVCLKYKKPYQVEFLLAINIVQKYMFEDLVEVANISAQQLLKSCYKFAASGK